MTGTDKSFTLPRGLALHYVEWGHKGAPPLILLHGRLDIARSWQPIAERLASRYRVLALDFRGHGGSDFVGSGGDYSVAGFLWDLAALVHEAIGPDERFVMVGHSLGGMVASYFAGLFPERVARLVNVEGFGPLDRTPERTRESLRRWLLRITTRPEKERRPYDSLAKAAEKLNTRSARLSDELALFLAEEGTERGADGKYRWRFDPRFRSSRALAFTAEQLRHIWGQIECPVLVIAGTASDIHQWAPDWRELSAAYPKVRIVEFEGLTHMMHQAAPEQVGDAIAAFLAEGQG